MRDFFVVAGLIVLTALIITTSFLVNRAVFLQFSAQCPPCETHSCTGWCKEENDERSRHACDR